MNKDKKRNIYVLVGKVVRDAKVVILGLILKKNCPDTRNRKVTDIINKLKECRAKLVVID